MIQALEFFARDLAPFGFTRRISAGVLEVLVGEIVKTLIQSIVKISDFSVRKRCEGLECTGVHQHL